ncbi:MAG: hypothetical protein FJ390_01650 [Verrucomicrobia bacterium]|nr:hypothetical protein [Verrucomicrobiota bacterium]
MKNLTIKQLIVFFLICSFVATQSCTAKEIFFQQGKSRGLRYKDLPADGFALLLKNDSNGKLRDDQIYIQILNLPTDQMTYVSLASTNVNAGPQGPGSVGIINVATANQTLPSFTLADVKNHTLYLPGDGKYYGTRIYISIADPLVMQVNLSANGYSQPNLENPTDPNHAITFDWFEMTYDATPQPNNPYLNTVAFGGNMTQVDEFGIPMAFTIQGDHGTTCTRGITLGTGSSSGVNSRDELIAKYLNSPDVSTPFKELTQIVDGRVVHLIAPFHGAGFKTGSAYANYFDDYINSVWDYYSSHELNFYDQDNTHGNHYVGNVVNGVLTFSRNGQGPFRLSKPTTYDVFTNSGAFLPGSMEANALGAQLAAAFNRHVAADPTKWLFDENYYQANPQSDWSKFWHSVSIDHLAYGFGFDDVGGKSSVAILPSSENLSTLTLDIGW